jgi:hypothetical protein
LTECLDGKTVDRGSPESVREITFFSSFSLSLSLELLEEEDDEELEVELLSSSDELSSIAVPFTIPESDFDGFPLDSNAS